MTIIRFWWAQTVVVLAWLASAVACGQSMPTDGYHIARCDRMELDTASCHCANVHLVLSQRTTPKGNAEQGVLYNGCFWKCEVCRVGSSLEFRLGNGVAPGPILDLYCERVKAGPAFNRRVHGSKEGIWLRPNGRLRVVTAVEFYEKGEKLKEVLFWPNGQPRQVTLYHAGKRRKTGFHRYDENGNPFRGEYSP